MSPTILFHTGLTLTCDNNRGYEHILLINYAIQLVPNSRDRQKMQPELQLCIKIAFASNTGQQRIY